MAKHSEIMKQVFAHMWGLVIVDHLCRIVYMEEKYARSRGCDPEAVIGCNVKDVVPTSKLPLVVETGKPLLGDVFYHKGKPLIVNRMPLVKDGILIGAISFQVFEVAETLFESIKELQSQLDYYKEKVKKYSGVRYSLADITGSSSAAKQIRAAILKAASVNSTVLIQGETGTGKELVAHALHQESRRAHYPFVKLNCAAIPQELIESELFGYEEGAFTGARKSGKKGRFEQAEKGTLFLDEISQLSPAAQAKLLRVLQEKEIERVGGSDSIPVDVRIVAATNDSLEDMVKQGTFRSDLFFRINVIPIKLPPLRERRTDIPLLVEKFAEIYGDQAGLGTVSVAPEALELLMKYAWPGNIRELEHAVERTIHQCNSSLLEMKHFEWLAAKVENRGHMTAGRGIQEAKAATEREMILNALRTTQGNKKKAAELLDIARPLLYQKMRRLGIQ
ncbi:sigma-54 interaction domain-containing protein [Acetonema longum]|uniref:Sigma-54 dependent transcription regulator n=1 Tax=Acetonema longum DSM 6540 TaxID=1009370 RepID=F7NMH2_9FIRM|nr:sigma 54-interacting transcriptional regulator [Acetonema longum]EGO62770.1 sigma-54 dependent transcription regulator [Acetonema longum DSM 6540]